MRHAAEFSPARRGRFQQPEEQADGGSFMCRAGGCWHQGSVSVGGTSGPFLCGFHAWADPKHWPGISSEMRVHDWYFGLIADLRGMLADGKRSEAISFAREFWADHPDMLPSDHEAKHLEHYLYRLHLDLQHRVGARTKKPGPMVAQAVSWANKKAPTPQPETTE
jgi:hypothetical protein